MGELVPVVEENKLFLSMGVRFLGPCLAIELGEELDDGAIGGRSLFFPSPLFLSGSFRIPLGIEKYLI